MSEEAGEYKTGPGLRKWPETEHEKSVVKRHNAHALPYAFFIWLGDKPLAGPMQENAAKESAVAINAAIDAEQKAHAKTAKQLVDSMAIEGSTKKQLELVEHQAEAWCRILEDLILDHGLDSKEPGKVAVDQVRSFLKRTFASLEQAERVAQVCYDLHSALGVKWGDDPYAVINRLKSSLDFYKRRCKELQRVQSMMRDPERKMVCDILANGTTYEKGVQ